jgi:hypothetical protein
MENVESSLNVISRKKICSEIGVSREPLFKLTEVKEWFSEGE